MLYLHKALKQLNMGITYNNSENSFHKELTQAVNDYFDQTGKKRDGGIHLLCKAFVLILLAFYIYYTLVFVVSTLGSALLLSAGLGVIFAFIGFNIMHDASHKSFSRYQWLNTIMLHTLELMGASSTLWYKKHVIIHHTFTNTTEDDDINIAPVLRIRKEDKRYWYHKYQAFYAPLAYSLLYVQWVFYNDFKKYFKKHIGNHEVKFTAYEKVVFWLSKVVYFLLFIAIPIVRHGFINTLVCYAVFAMTCGLLISIIFQLAHVVHTSTFPSVNVTTGTIETPWAISQLQETSDFATKSLPLFILLGGLNFQTVHHLFPRISHIHYPALAKIVARISEKFGLTYNRLSFTSALYSHFSYLHHAGNFD